MKNNTDRRNFIRNISLGIIGTGLTTPAFSENKILTHNKILPLNHLNNLPEELLLENGLSYFNTGSLGPTPLRIIDKIREINFELESNPVGKNWGKIGNMADTTRELIASFINAEKEEIFLTRNTTEGLNLLAMGLQLSKNDEIITTTDEHEGSLAGWNFLEKYYQVKVKRIAIPRDNISKERVIELIKKEITPQTKVCSFMDVSTITGMRMPIKEISKLTRPKNIFLICDGAQSLGMLNIDIQKLDVDAFAASGHKWLLGPKETGFLYLNKKSKNQIKHPQLESGFNAYNHNTGTKNVANIIGLGEIIKLNKNWGGMLKIEEHNLNLGRYLKEELQKNKNSKLISPLEECSLSGLSSIILKNKSAKEVYKELNNKKIVVKKLDKQNVLRFSTHIFNTEKEVNLLLSTLHSVLK